MQETTYDGSRNQSPYEALIDEAFGYDRQTKNHFSWGDFRANRSTGQIINLIFLIYLIIKLMLQHSIFLKNIIIDFLKTNLFSANHGSIILISNN